MFSLWHAIFLFPVGCHCPNCSQTNKEELSTLLLTGSESEQQHHQTTTTTTVALALNGSGLSGGNEHDTLASGKRLHAGFRLGFWIIYQYKQNCR